MKHSLFLIQIASISFFTAYLNLGNAPASEVISRESKDSHEKVEGSKILPNPKSYLVGGQNGNLALIWVEPGTFMMGSPEFEWQRDSTENQRRVTLTRGFYLGKYEVTQAQYFEVMGELPRDPVKHPGKNIPVGASWEDAMAFCKKLTEMEARAGRLPEGMSFQLPTEAEWEYSCRAGTTTVYWWGNDHDITKAHYQFPFVKPWKGSPKPVGQFPPNPWGFHDMHGNVYEWCDDHTVSSRPYPSGSATDPVARYAGESSRFQRGGSFWSDASQVRSAHRHSHPLTDNPYGDKGFRVVLKYGAPPPEALPDLNAELEFIISPPN